MYIEFILIFILSLVLVNLMKYNASKLGFVDIPNTRSTHKDYIPTATGIAFFLAVAIILPLFSFDYMLNYFWTFLFVPKHDQIDSAFLISDVSVATRQLSIIKKMLSNVTLDISFLSFDLY